MKYVSAPKYVQKYWLNEIAIAYNVIQVYQKKTQTKYINQLEYSAKIKLNFIYSFFQR